MDPDHRDRTHVDGDPEVAAQDRLNMQPGGLEDIENATAYANRTGQEDTTSLRPERAGDDAGAGERQEADRGDAGEPRLPPDADPGPDVAPFPSSADPMR